MTPWEPLAVQNSSVSMSRRDFFIHKVNLWGKEGEAGRGEDITGGEGWAPAGGKAVGWGRGTHTVQSRIEHEKCKPGKHFLIAWRLKVVVGARRLLSWRLQGCCACVSRNSHDDRIHSEKDDGGDADSIAATGRKTRERVDGQHWIYITAWREPETASKDIWSGADIYGDIQTTSLLSPDREPFVLVVVVGEDTI